MASAGRPDLGPDHWIDPELRQLPSERGPRRKRRLWVVILAVIVSIVVHLAAIVGCIALILYLFPVRLLPPEPPERESLQVFVMPTPAPSPDAPPVTEQISDRNTRANSPGEGQPQPSGETLPSEGGSPDAAEPPPGTHEPPPSEPTLHPVTEEPAPVTSVDKRTRIADALRGMGGHGNDWGSLSVPGNGGAPSSGIGYSSGDSSFQIESKADVDWGPWSRKVQGLVRSNWYSIMPVAARVGMQGVARVRFVVHRDGAITDFELLDSAGLLPLDQAVQTTLVNLSNPLPPLPLSETDEDTIRITYTFLYNISNDRELRAWQRQRWLEKKRQEGGG